MSQHIVFNLVLNEDSKMGSAIFVALRKHPTRNNPERNKPEIRKNPEHVHKARK